MYNFLYLLFQMIAPAIVSGRNVRTPPERYVGNAHPRVTYQVKTRAD